MLPHPYKVCPLYIIPHWAEFIKRVASYMQPSVESEYLYRVCVGSFAQEDNARQKLKEVKKTYPDAFLIKTIKAK